jgi:serine kinase of HPr protein (carbohydrate metabolism regulator)
MDKIERTKSENVLSLHVRRGDYALPANRMAGMLSYDYYREALMRTGDHDSIWIFTDSPKEVENEFSQLKHRFDVIVPPKDSDPVESLLLMASTKNIVISNSTFSWWSAMIAGDTASIHAPSKWYEHRADPSKLIPENWKRIPSEWVQR